MMIWNKPTTQKPPPAPPPPLRVVMQVEAALTIRSVSHAKIRSLADLPADDIQTDPLRILVNVWRQRGKETQDPVIFNMADELCTILNCKES